MAGKGLRQLISLHPWPRSRELVHLFSTERKKESMELGGLKGEEGFVEVGGGETMIRIYSMKKYSQYK